MNSVRFRGLLFDLDGVLVDSTPAVARVWAWWARQHGFDPDETVRQAHGRPSISTIRELLPNVNHEVENKELERREIEDVEDVIPLPGAVELLQAIPPQKWAIVTSCTRRLAEVRIAAAGLPKPKQMITSNDITAIGALGTLHDSGLEVPRDISLIGFDDISFANMTQPPLTTVRLSRSQLAITALAALEKLIRKEEGTGTHYTIPTHLVMRGSTRTL